MFGCRVQWKLLWRIRLCQQLLLHGLLNGWKSGVGLSIKQRKLGCGVDVHDVRALQREGHQGCDDGAGGVATLGPRLCWHRDVVGRRRRGKFRRGSEGTQETRSDLEGCAKYRGADGWQGKWNGLRRDSLYACCQEGALRWRGGGSQAQLQCHRRCAYPSCPDQGGGRQCGQNPGKAEGGRLRDSRRDQEGTPGEGRKGPRRRWDSRWHPGRQAGNVGGVWPRSHTGCGRGQDGPPGWPRAGD
mmetsp:Transcript_21764/g.48107  ORF Transcript_21764/g.48107 Transcript_21764/m.48107 type:complete len:243 (-) Transcript_21764:2173-2901(-)